MISDEALDPVLKLAYSSESSRRHACAVVTLINLSSDRIVEAGDAFRSSKKWNHQFIKII